MNDFLNDFESLFGAPDKPKRNRDDRDFTKEEQTTQANLDAKKLITIRLDRDILAYFQKQGEGYQTRINNALREFMNQRLKK